MKNIFAVFKGLLLEVVSYSESRTHILIFDLGKNMNYWLFHIVKLYRKLESNAGQLELKSK